MLTRTMCLLLSFETRISRRGFWLGIGLLSIFALATIWIVGTFALPYWEPHVISGVAMLVLLYPSLAVGVKRLHDRNKSAFPWAFIYFGPQVLTHVTQFFNWGWEPWTQFPLGPQGVMIMQPTNTLTWVLAVLSVAALVAAFIELGFMKGSDGENRYGRTPESMREGDFVCAT